MKLSRRKFLGALGASAVVSGTSSSLLGKAHAEEDRFRSSFIRSDRFGRLFPDLPPFFKGIDPRSTRLRDALLKIGMRGGILDAKDVLGNNDEAAAIALIVNAGGNPDNVAPHTAGTTFMGQFLDHDCTFDQTSRLGIVTEPTESPNTRDPRYDLDSVYGDGPLANPELYQPVPRGSRGRPTKLRIESGGLFEDVPRDSSGTAIIADPRNDENMMISGLQAAVILFHNHAVDVLKDEDRGLDSEELFEKARRLTTWHYQWMIVHEFLPLFIGQKLVDDIFNNGRKFFRPDKPFIPVEFQGATYRFGHSMVRPSYRANLAGDNDPASPGGLAFFGMIFVPDTDPRVHTSDPIDLRGGARARRRFIGWQTFFDFGPTFTDPGSTNPAIRRNKKIDSLISSPLFELPVGTIAGAPPNEAIISLPQRNLLRHITWSLPSGQDIARFIRVPQLSTADTGLSSFGLGLDEDTPLWYYALKEAELMTGGISLGPVGGRIVGEVFAGLLKLDQDSYLNARDRWKPTLPQRNGSVTGDFKMIDFLTFAGVAPDQRGQ
jgi:Animal haem peroxidase